MDDVNEEGYNYDISFEVLLQGAEARVYDCLFLGRKGILKERFSKKYRHPTLDNNINGNRFKNEIKCIAKASKLGAQVPAVLFIDSTQCKFIMSKIDGPTAKTWIEERRNSGGEEFKKDIALFGQKLGHEVAKLHAGGLIHGDLTTSNIILKGGIVDDLVFIDFGLSQQGKISPEEKGVDLYVLERAIASTHHNCEDCFHNVLEGYKQFNAKQATVVIQKLDEIRLRGRKRDMTG